MSNYEYKKISKEEIFDEKVFDKILYDLNECYLSLDIEITDYYSNLDELKDILKLKTKTRAKIGINLTTIVLTISIMLGLPVIGTIKLNDLSKKNTTVLETSYTYESGKLPVITEERVNINDAEDKKYIVLVEPYNELNYRNITTYDISNINMPSIIDYYNLNLSKIENKTETIEYKKDYSDTGNTEEVKRLIIKNIDFSDQATAFPKWLIILFYFVYIAFLLTVEYTYYAFNYYDLTILADIMKILKNNTKKLKELNSDEVNIKIMLEVLINEINTLLSQSEELSNKWNSLFSKNKYLLSDPSELLERYDELISKLKKEIITFKKTIK